MNTNQICEIIQNCSSSEWFGKCTLCKTDYAFTDFNYEECLPTSVSNCYLRDKDDEDVCILCEAGFTKNREG